MKRKQPTKHTHTFLVLIILAKVLTNFFTTKSQLFRNILSLCVPFFVLYTTSSYFYTVASRKFCFFCTKSAQSAQNFAGKFNYVIISFISFLYQTQNPNFSNTLVANCILVEIFIAKVSSFRSTGESKEILAEQKGK